MRAPKLFAMRCSLLSAFFVPVLVLGQAQYDARILSYEGIGQVCDGMVQPRLKIMNQGSEVMFTCVVETWKNGLIDNSFNWELAVGAVQDEVRQPTFPAVEVSDGDMLEFRIISVNAQPDEVVDGNNITVSITDDATELSTAIVMVDLVSEPECGPFMWSFHDASGSVVANGNVVVSQAEEVWVELATNACYEFRARLADDGSSGDCIIQLFCNGELVEDVSDLSSGERRVGLHTGATVGVTEEENVEQVLFPVPVQERLFVTGIQGNGPVRTSIMDATGRVVRNDANAVIDGRMTIDVQGLATGRYILTMQDGDRIVRPRSFVVE